jgi:ferredoxin
MRIPALDIARSLAERFGGPRRPSYPARVPTLRFLPAEISCEVAKGTRLSDAVSAAGMPMARACGDDLVCAKCGVRILEGRVSREAAVERRAKARNRVAPELRLACAIRVQGDLTLTADYW